MKVSVLVPIYNVSPFLHRFLGSLWQQTYKDVEFIFCDDCSTDDSYEVLQKEIGLVNTNCRVINHQKNEGIAQTRNDLLKASVGEYVVFVDSDDWLEPDYIENLVISSDGYDIVQCGYYEERPNRQILHHAFLVDNHDKLLYDAIAVNMETFLWTKLIKRSLINEFSFYPGINHGEDYIACIWLYVHTEKINIIDKQLYHYNRMNLGSITRNNNYQKFIMLFDMTESFLLEFGLLPKFQAAFNQRIFMFKKDLILCENPEWNLYVSYRPEVNHFWRIIPLGKINRLIFFFLEKKMMFLSKFLKSFKSFG